MRQKTCTLHRGKVGQARQSRVGLWAAIASAAGAVVCSLAPQAHATTLVYNGGISGNSTTWDGTTTTLNWLRSSTATAWGDVTHGNDAALFSSTTTTKAVTITAGGINTNQLVFLADLHTFSGGPINMTSTVPVIGFQGGNSGQALTETFDSQLTGSNGLTIQAAAAMTLDNVILSGANTYTGVTTINAATLTLRNTNVSTDYVANGGALKLDFVNSAAPLLDSSSVLALRGNASLQMVGKASSLSSQTVATLNIGPGATSATLAGGASGSAYLKFANVNHNVGGTLNITQAAGTLSGTHGYATDTANTDGLLGTGITVGGTDWATNNGTNIVAYTSYSSLQEMSGWTTAAAENKNISNTTAGFTSTGALPQDLTISSLRFNRAAGSWLDLGGKKLAVTNGILETTAVVGSGTEITNGSITGAASKDLVVIQNNTNATGLLRISANVVDNGAAVALTKSGAGVLQLSGANSHSGGTYVNQGTINANANNALGTGAFAMLNGTTLDNTSGSPVTLGNNAVSLGTSGSPNSLTFFTTASSGSKITLGTPGAPVTIQAGTASLLTASSGNSMAITVNGTNTVLEIAGNISGAATGFWNFPLIKEGTGTLALSGTNNFPGTGRVQSPIRHRNGTIALNSAGAITGATGFKFDAADKAIDNTSAGDVTLTGGVPMTVTNSFTFVGTRSLNYGTGVVTLNTASPVITVLANTLTFDGTVVNDATGGRNLTKAGAGTLVLNKVNTYTGSTTITGGKLSIGSAGTINTSTGLIISAGEFNYNNATVAFSKPITTFAAGSVLSGSGKITSTVGGEGTISPGNSPGILTVSQIDPTSGQDYAFEMTTVGSPTYASAVSSGNDVLRLTGATPISANLGASNVVNVYLNVASLQDGDTFKGGFYADTGAGLASAVANASYAYYVLDAAGATVFNGVNYSPLASLYPDAVVTPAVIVEAADFGAGTVNGSVTSFVIAVPEPASMTLLGGAMVLMGRRRRM